MRALGLLALVFAGACTSHPDIPPEQLLTSAREQLRSADLGEALSLAARGLEHAKTAPGSPLHWQLKLLRGEILLLRRELDSVEPLLREQPPQGAEFAAVHARRTCLQGQFQISAGKLDDALVTLGNAERLAHASGEQDVHRASRALRGQAEMRMGRWDDGRTTLSALVLDAERAGDDYHLAIALINLGMGYKLRDRYDDALPHFERAMKLDRVTMRIRAIALNNAGLCYARLGDFDRAVEVQKRAVQVHENGPRIFLAQALGELGTTYMLMRNLPEAASHLTRALQVATDANLTDLATLWATTLASLYIDLRQWDDAERFNQRSRSLNLAGNSAGLAYNLLNDGDIASGRGDPKAAMAYYDRARATDSTDPFVDADAHAGLARCYLAAGRTKEAGAHFETALAIIARTQSGLLKTDYKLTYLTRLTDRYGEYIASLMAQKRFDRALEVADSSRARVLAERHGVKANRRSSAAEFKRLAADARSTLLVYWTGRERSYGWAVTKDRIDAVELPNAGEIEALVRAHQTAVVTSLADVLQTAEGPGDALYAKLVAPFASALGPGTSVLIVPDGALTRMNFETLPVNGAKRRYWLEDVTVSVAPSLGTIVTATNRAAARTPTSVLLFGDPAPSDPEFPRLQYAAAEIDAVTRAFPQAQTAVFRGDQASPSAFRDARPGRFGLIHFTAHAAANAESPLDSAVILARDAGGYKLYARDIAEQKLDADLVTISACRSAGDRTYSGEGLVGFAWAFLRAGARRVLAGLWDVDDRSTAQLMTALYARLAEGQAPAEALRSAKLALIAGGGSQAKPYYWGPFQLIVATP